MIWTEGTVCISYNKKWHRCYGQNIRLGRSSFFLERCTSNRCLIHTLLYDSQSVHCRFYFNRIMIRWVVQLVFMCPLVVPLQADPAKLLECFEKVPNMGVVGKFVAKTELWGASLYKCLDLCIRSKGNGPTVGEHSLDFNGHTWTT